MTIEFERRGFKISVSYEGDREGGYEVTARLITKPDEDPLPSPLRQHDDRKNPSVLASRGWTQIRGKVTRGGSWWHTRPRPVEPLAEVQLGRAIHRAIELCELHQRRHGARMVIQDALEEKLLAGLQRLDD